MDRPPTNVVNTVQSKARIGYQSIKLYVAWLIIIIGCLIDWLWQELWRIMKRNVSSMKQLVIRRVEKMEYEPRDWMEFILLTVGVAFAFFWVISVLLLSGMTIENAKWVLSTQSQATAAILGLLIVAVIFRWTRVVEQESQLRNSVHHYIRKIASHHTLSIADFTSPTIVLAYKDYYNVLSGMKRRKEVTKAALISLGRMWVLKEMSDYYSYSNLPPYGLKRGQIKQLLEISAVTGDSASTMWSHYFSRPSEFMLEMFETLTHVNSTTLSVENGNGNSSSGGNDIRTFADKYRQLEEYRKEMFNDAPEWKLEAERLTRIRKGTLSPFYAVCIILFLAVLTGFLGIIGIDNAKLVEDVTLPLLVGLPTGLSAFGFFMSLVMVVRIIR